jgi:hypothetical protein
MPNNGGPAFPTGTQISQNNTTGETTVFQYLTDGMTLRDYFAAKAMDSYLRSPQAEIVSVKTIAECAYEMADQMLIERNK